MSIYSQESCWSESAGRLALSLPLRGVPSKEVTVTQTTAYLRSGSQAGSHPNLIMVRVTFPPFFYEVVLKAAVKPEVTIFKLYSVLTPDS